MQGQWPQLTRTTRALSGLPHPRSSHPEASIRTLTLHFVTLLVIGDEYFRDYFIQHDIIQLVEGCQMLALLNRLDEEYAAASFCLQMLREPCSILFSIEPHRLSVVGHHHCEGYVDNEDRCTVYVRSVTSGRGFCALIENTL